ncbi:MAG: Exodeoxyribonuclease 7 small subunit [Candidatus Saccharibacteria bacterium]|nr:Exodeoxyribonuclease 7 small subunit [Candidatus Saccharibacteria bacterium]
MTEKKSSKNYAQLSEELAGIIAWFEGGDVDIDSAIAKYEQAMKLVAELEAYLKTAENKIKKITAHHS